MRSYCLPQLGYAWTAQFPPHLARTSCGSRCDRCLEALHVKKLSPNAVKINGAGASMMGRDGRFFQCGSWLPAPGRFYRVYTWTVPHRPSLRSKTNMGHDSHEDQKPVLSLLPLVLPFWITKQVDSGMQSGFPLSRVLAHVEVATSWATSRRPSVSGRTSTSEILSAERFGRCQGSAKRLKYTKVTKDISTLQELRILVCYGSGVVTIGMILVAHALQ